MIELLYPDTFPAPVFKGTKSSSASEMVPVVDPNGIVSAQIARKLCHTGKNVLHPVVHLHIINRKGELYLQKRGAERPVYPNLWDFAVGGHIIYGEQVLEALLREAREELKISDFNPQFLTTYVFESEKEQELVFSFATVGDFTPEPSSSELSGGMFWTIDKIEKAIGTGELTPSFEFEYPKIKNSLLSLL